MESTKRPAVWVPGAIISQCLRYVCPESFDPLLPARWRTLGMAAYWCVFMLAMSWLKLVSENVPEPYLDEIFHIPQAQLYCEGQYDYWDPKLTTPPGLYIFATVFSKLRFAACSVSDLRLFNATVLPLTMAIALACRHLIRHHGSRSEAPSDAIHTAANIALFPPLFFFAGLFYTDLLSTCIVLLVYRCYLKSDSRSNWIVFPIGIIALLMRQTNIFWVAVFLGGLETVRTVSTDPTARKEDRLVPGQWKERARFEIDRWRIGNIHDIHLTEAGVTDYVLCVLSIAVAAIYRPIQLIVRLLPYLALLTSFALFVFWNGGVVLGDKSNHVATIHLPQLLYLSAFTAFFALPLLITPLFSFLKATSTLLELPSFPRLQKQYLLVSFYTTAALVGVLGIIKFNTIIHPFTLADNRHYVFYVFRYTILRHPLIRYLLAPIYMACAWAVYLTLCSPSEANRLHLKKSDDNKATKRSSRSPPVTKEYSADGELANQDGPKTSFLIIFLVATSLSLITAPLVEPRYFIIPWIIWRLHVPSLPRNPATKNAANDSVATNVKLWAYKNHDYRLWLETCYFLAINALTGYVFLYKGFTWPQEPGNVQRFMW